MKPIVFVNVDGLQIAKMSFSRVVYVPLAVLLVLAALSSTDARSVHPVT